MDWYLKDELASGPVGRCGIRPGGGSLRYTCKSPYRCVPCSIYRLEERRSELREALSYGVEDLAHLTLTQAHRSSDLRKEWDALEATLHRFTYNGSWTRFKKPLFISGYSVTVEITRSSQGWHPHAHLLLAFSQKVPSGAVDALVAALTERWVAAAAYLGNEALASRQDISMVPKPQWGNTADYVTKQHLKHLAKPKRGQTPGDILRLAHAGDPDAVALFLEYTDAAYNKPLIRRYGSLSPTSGKKKSTDN